jgi:TRAP-type C4-dicarboxylate transport system permease small subunit
MRIEDKTGDKESYTPPAVRHLLKAVRYVVGFLLLAGLGLNVANVIARYIVLKPIIAAEEILSFGMVWCIFLGAALVTWDGRHLRMDIVHLLMPRLAKRVLGVIGVVAFVVFCSVVFVSSSQVVRLVARNAEVSVVAQIPMTVPWAAIPIGFALMVVLMLVRVRDFISGRLEDDAHLGEIVIEEAHKADDNRS